jgi:protein involved in polysaccharide export with SLBB domain
MIGAKVARRLSPSLSKCILGNYIVFRFSNSRLIWNLALALTLMLSVGFATTGQSQSNGSPNTTAAYELGPMDAITLRAVIWNNAALTFQNIDAISGTYTINSDGRVMLPIIGGVVAAGTVADDLAERVAVALMGRMGSREAPSVAIEVTSYRPVFVLGEVARPGEYDFRPGMRAVQLLALAGGYYRLSEIDGGRLELDSLRVSGGLQELDVNLAMLHVRKTRLEAEAAGQTSFDVTDGLSHPGGAPALAGILAREREIFDTQRESHALEIESLESTQTLLERERTVLTQKLEGIVHQVAIMAEAVGNLEALLERGLTRSPALLNSQRALFELEARELDAENQIFRASQSLTEVERDLNQVIQNKTRENLTQLQAINAEIDQMTARRETQRSVLAVTYSAASLLNADEAAELIPVFRIARTVDGAFVTETVTSDAVLRPLDTLEISWTVPGVPPPN